ncbi:unnamed protein product, partial [Vitis vinifera]
MCNLTKITSQEAWDHHDFGADSMGEEYRAGVSTPKPKSLSYYQYDSLANHTSCQQTSMAADTERRTHHPSYAHKPIWYCSPTHQGLTLHTLCLDKPPEPIHSCLSYTHYIW